MARSTWSKRCVCSSISDDHSDNNSLSKSFKSKDIASFNMIALLSIFGSSLIDVSFLFLNKTKDPHIECIINFPDITPNPQLTISFVPVWSFF